MIDKLFLAMGNIVSIYKSLNINLPDEVQEFVEDNVFLFLFSYFSINNQVNNRLLSLFVTIFFQIFLYNKEKILLFLKQYNLKKRAGDFIYNFNSD